MSKKFLLAGVAALSAGAMLIALAAVPSGGSTAFAGEEECVTFTPTNSPTRTNTPTATNTTAPTDTPEPTQPPINAFGNLTQVPQLTCEPTNTPTRTNTPAPSATTAPSSTPRPATNTPTGGGAGVVQPPDTGTGDGLRGGETSMWYLLAGGALLALGGGAVLAGAKRRS
jgi:hypothetical protein